MFYDRSRFQRTSRCDSQLKHLGRPVLTRAGSISHEAAERVVETEYAKFDHIRRQYRQLEADQEIAELKQTADYLPKSRTTKKNR